MITMTVYKVEADLIEVTPFAEPPGTRYLPGRVFVSAQGEGERHYWPLQEGQRCWIGDTVRVQVIEDDRDIPSILPPRLKPPPIDKRGAS